VSDRALHRVREDLPLVDFLGKLRTPCGAQAIHLDAPALRRLGLRTDNPPAILEAIQGRIQGSLSDVEDIARELLDALRDGPAVEGTRCERVEDEQVEGTLQEIGFRQLMLGHSTIDCHALIVECQGMPPKGRGDADAQAELEIGRRVSIACRASGAVGGECVTPTARGRGRCGLLLARPTGARGRSCDPCGTRRGARSASNVGVTPNQLVWVADMSRLRAVEYRFRAIGFAYLALAWGCSNSTTIDPATDLHLIRISPGHFLMGSPVTEADRGPDEQQHLVTLTHELYVGRDEVTQDEWARFVGSRPSFHAGCGLCPVERVNFLDVQQLLVKLNEKSEQFQYRLPTEAEWEYACRAGQTTPFATGTTLTTDQANFNGSNPPSFDPGKDNLAKTTPVGSFPPNRWGFRDMHGNVWEWTADWYGAYPLGAVSDPSGPPSGEKRVIRGGSWAFGADSARCACRYTHAPIDLGFSLGVRVAATRRKRDP
jgi:sulfatase modifying factor 1